jgi:rhamnulose-1-phosphate aldolase/alcohol dehydrogenase
MTRAARSLRRDAERRHASGRTKMSAESAARLANLWNDTHAATLDEPGLLLYRSNLLGSDLRITNFGGGNTSAKVMHKDPLTGADVEVLWVKGSGGDIGSMKRDGFSTLYMEKLEHLKTLYRGLAHEDEMVGYLPHCTFDLNPRAASIDTPLHAFVPFKHVDHVHPDAVIAIAASKNAEALTKQVYGGSMGFLPWQRPGFDLGLKLGKMARDNPQFVGVVLGGHGVFTWADDAKACYLLTLEILQQAADWLEANGRKPSFGGAKIAALGPAERQAVASRLMPEIRARISKDTPKIGYFDDSPAVLDFVNSHALATLAPMGTSCPDHFLRTKIAPLVIPFDAAAGVDASIAGLDGLISDYVSDYRRYYDTCRHANSPAMRDPNAVIHLVPGVGLISFAKDKTTARQAGEFYVNAINVMRGATSVDTYVALPQQEAFNIEYWLLEEAKLQRMPKAKPLAGKVAVVTGGAGGIGAAIADRLMAEGAVVMIADRDAAAAADVASGFRKKWGVDAAHAVVMDVTREEDVIRTFAETARLHGGVDIVVNNAGISSAANVEDTTLELWNHNMSILATGYFLVAREGYRLMKTQGLGGSMIFIGSKNGVSASAGASAYCTAKAAEIHLARCMALEGAPLGIRINVVNPDAVLRGSKIWQGEWRQQRASSNKIAEDDLEEFYRNRSLLKRSVFPEDIAEAVHFFANESLSGKSTGNFLNVDAGNVVSFAR